MAKAFGFSEYGGPDVQDFLDLEVPSPMAGELLIEVRAAGVNPVDWKIREGAMREFRPIQLPVALGAEAAGVVREVGQDVHGFAVGDEVFGSTASGSGGYAEFTLLTAANSAHKPPQVTFEQASTLTVAAATALDGVNQADLQPGQTLLINGVSGGVGVAAAQIARDRDINVIGTAGADKRALVESLGATLVPYGDGVAERIEQIMPQGVDAVFDLAGGDSLRAVATVLRNRAKLISAADPATAAELGGLPFEPDRTSTALTAVAALVAEGKLDPKIEDVLSLDDAAQALAAVEVGHAKGKVVIRVSG